MSDTLIIRLLDRPARNQGDDARSDSVPLRAQWLLVDATGSRLGMVFEGSLDEAATLAITRRVIVLLPGTQVLAAEPLLPAKRGMQLDQVARYALEESSASDIDELHVAIGKRTIGGKTPVLLVQHRVLGEYLAALNAVSIQPDLMYAELDVVPSAANSNYLVIDRGITYVRHGASQAATLDVQPLDEALGLALSFDESASVISGDNLIYITQSDYETSSRSIDHWRAQANTPINLQIKTLPEGPLPLFALEAVKLSALNLLTGPYARKKSWDSTFAPWRVAAVLAGVAVSLYLLASGLQFWRLGKIEAQLDDQIKNVFMQTLPGASASDFRNARKQFEARLNSLTSSQGGSSLMVGLNVLGNALQQFPEMRVETLAFSAKTLNLRVVVPNVDALDRIQHLAAEQGIIAEIQSATPRDNKVEGRLQFKASNT